MAQMPNSLDMMDEVTANLLEPAASTGRFVNTEGTTDALWDTEDTSEALTETILATLNLNVSAWEGGVLPREKCDFLLEINYSLPNLTCLNHAPEFTSESQVRSIVLAVMAALSLVGNTATIVSIAREKRRSRSTVYTLIHHLSVADLFVTFTCLTAESIWTFTVQWVAGNFLCKLIKYLQMFSLYLSTFILVLIGVDRFTAVRYPMRRSGTQRHSGYGIIFVWVLSAVLSIPQALVFHVVRGPFYEEFYQCVTYGLYSPAWLEQVYGIFSLVCMFVLPLLVLLVTYVSTFITLHKSEKVFRSERTTLGNTCPEFNRRRLLRKAKMRALRISVVIVLAFVICWTPYYMMMIIFMFTQVEENVAAELQSGIFFFGMSNSLVNPLIYGAFHLCRCHRRKASFNLIIINRNGSNLRYRASGRNSTRSTTCRSSAAEMDTSVVNVFEDGVRYSFRRQSSRQRSLASPRAGALDMHSGLHGSFRHSRYGGSSKGLLGSRHVPKTSLSYPHEGFSPLSQGLAEEEEEQEGLEWSQTHQGSRADSGVASSNGRRNSLDSWSRSKNTPDLLPSDSETENVVPPSKLLQQCPCNSYSLLQVDMQRHSDTQL
ncbi:gonadotropin-releasing hormone receptor [Procambarus clarkii]|uniref:gonadotropin-releasing hormone receptor n=1 Tax=Procambarus clarkii TaxID=6728 RepID=UPI003742747F